MSKLSIDPRTCLTCNQLRTQGDFISDSGAPMAQCCYCASKAFKPFLIVRKPVGVSCAACIKAKRQPPGVMFRLNLSRLEEGLGHEGFECDKCGERVKYVPQKEG